MTAKIYVPAPGRPPEWVVDLMLGELVSKQSGRWRVHKMDGLRSQPGWPVEPGEAIRLNEDGSLEIIDAPKEEPMPREDMEDLPGLLRANAELEESPCCAGQMRAAADDIETLMAMVTNVALAIEAFPSLRRLSAEPTFTKSEVVEAMLAARDRAPFTRVIETIYAVRDVANALGFETEFQEALERRAATK